MRTYAKKYLLAPTVIRIHAFSVLHKAKTAFVFQKEPKKTSGLKIFFYALKVKVFFYMNDLKEI